MFCYETASKSHIRSDVTVNVWRMNANRAYMRHFENFLFLDFILNNGNMNERHQAKLELAICERKMTFWERHPTFEVETVKALKEKMLVGWKSGASKAHPGRPAITTKTK
jgi:hypothetical protein